MAKTTKKTSTKKSNPIATDNPIKMIDNQIEQSFEVFNHEGHAPACSIDAVKMSKYKSLKSMHEYLNLSKEDLMDALRNFVVDYVLWQNKSRRDTIYTNVFLA